MISTADEVSSIPKALRADWVLKIHLQVSAQGQNPWLSDPLPHRPAPAPVTPLGALQAPHMSSPGTQAQECQTPAPKFRNSHSFSVV